MSFIVAFPSEQPGGLEARLSMHFGHSEMFTLLTVDEGQVKEVKAVPGIPHEHGGCLAPVGFLAEQGVKALVAGGMGMRPLMGFNQAGIEVLHNSGLPTVGQAAEAFIEGKLPRFGQDQTCGGGKSGAGCGGHNLLQIS